jgi:galactose mutarotase-like enzyme
MTDLCLRYKHAELSILEHGLHLHRLTIAGRDVLVGPADPSVLVQERSFRNCIIGRYANRLPSTLPDGTPLEGGDDSGVVLHGGVCLPG